MSALNKDYGVTHADKERRKNNRKAVISLIAALIILLTFFLGYFVRGITEPAEGQKINEIIKIINAASIYADDKNADELAELVRKVILSEDAYAKYYTPEEYRRVLAEDRGNYEGVGVAFSAATNDRISKVYLNSPAHKAGVKAGDQLVAGIYKGDEEYTVFSDLLESENQGKSDKEKKTILQIFMEFFSAFDIGDEISFKVKRNGVETEFTLEKSNYVVSYVEYSDSEKAYCFSTEEDGFKGREKDGGQPELSEDTAYIKLHEFQGDAANQFGQAIKYMNSRGRSKLILDLRNNGGGLVNIMCEIASYLINDNGAANIRVMRAEGKANISSYFTSSNKYSGWLTDISVIANTGTASASECLIGVLNDYGGENYGGAAFGLDRLILTEKHSTRGYYSTFGKGIMQTTYSLKSGGALTLTTAKIYWPVSKSVCVQDVGIKTTEAQNEVTDAEAISRANAVLH